MDDDNHAIHRLKNRDIGGLEILVCRYQVKAVRAAFFILHDPQQAEDVTQDTFLRVFRHIHRFDESRPFGPYLLKCVVYAALDLAQKENHCPSLPDGLESVENLLQHAITVEEQVDFNDLKKEILQALSRLSPRQRAVVVMRYYLEMSEADMSESLHIAPGTVKWLLHAARERLRRLLGLERSAK